jgi:hypothetical protein
MGGDIGKLAGFSRVDGGGFRAVICIGAHEKPFDHPLGNLRAGKVRPMNTPPLLRAA